MAVLMGEGGQIELRRSQVDEAFLGKVTRSDVNTTKDRFSFDFPFGMLITGDQVEIKSTDKSNLDFIDPSGWPTNKVYRNGIFYIYVDEVGAIRLYNNFDEAIAGEVSGRIDLVDPGRNIPIKIKVRNNNERILAQIREFEINTERSTIDVSALSDEFKRHYSGLISGSGRITCLFDYERKDCDPAYGDAPDQFEAPIYINQLMLRTRLGSEFWAKVTLVNRGGKSYGETDDTDDQIWYEFDARITNIAMTFTPGEPVESIIEYVTTGKIKLRTKSTDNYLTQETTDSRIRQEANQSGFIEIEQQD